MNGKWIFCKTEKWRMQKPKVKNPFICKIQFVQKGEKWTNLLSICVCVYDVSSLSTYIKIKWNQLKIKLHTSHCCFYLGNIFNPNEIAIINNYALFTWCKIGTSEIVRLFYPSELPLPRWMTIILHCLM